MRLLALTIITVILLTYMTFTLQQLHSLMEPVTLMIFYHHLSTLPLLTQTHGSPKLTPQSPLAQSPSPLTEVSKLET